MVITKENTHIMGTTGMGKTYFAYQEALNLVQEKQKVFYVSTYDDVSLSGLEKKVITNESDISDICSVLLNGSALHIIFPKGELGSEKAIELLHIFLGKIIGNLEAFSGYFMFLDEVQDFNKDDLNTLLSEASKYNIAIILIHQYLDQFSEEGIKDVFFFCKKGIYFSLPKFDIPRVILAFKAIGCNESDFTNQPQGKYIVLEK